MNFSSFIANRTIIPFKMFTRVLTASLKDVL